MVIMGDKNAYRNTWWLESVVGLLERRGSYLTNSNRNLTHTHTFTGCLIFFKI